MTAPRTAAGRALAELVMDSFEAASMDGERITPHILAIEAEAAPDATLREAAVFMLDLIDKVYGTDNEGMDLPEEADYRRHRAVIQAAS